MIDITLEKKMNIDPQFLDVYVTMRVKEITVEEWEAIHGREYTQSGDPTKGIYGVAIRWNYHCSSVLIGGDFGLTRSQAMAFCKKMKSMMVPTFGDIEIKKDIKAGIERITSHAKKG